MATIERPPWKYRTKAEREIRDTAILEKWAMGWTKEMIAHAYDLTSERIHQIVQSFGGEGKGRQLWD